jgi:hypothetical protein
MLLAPLARRWPLATFTLLLVLAVTPRPARAGDLVNPFQAFGWSPYGNQFAGQFGFSVAPAGDVNGDGFGDVIVGAFGEDNQYMDEGRAHIFLGSPTGPRPRPSVTTIRTRSGPRPGSRFPRRET